MIRVGFNARIMVDPARRGFNRYTYSLAKALLALGGVEVWLISDAPIHETFLRDLDVGVLVRPARKPIWWEQVVLPQAINDLALDVFHAPGSLGLPLRRVCPYVLTIHDVMGRAAPEIVGGNTLKARVYNRVFQAVSLHAADKIITDSEYSKRDICQHLGVSAERIEVIHLGADAQFHPIGDRETITEVLNRHGVQRPYLLYVGGFDRRKNVEQLIKAFNCATLDASVSLVLVGEPTGEHLNLSEQVRMLGLHERVRFVGYIPDQDLAALYNGATAFVYPSLYEGFGLPAVEAMASGVPILVSNRTSLPEIVDGAAFFFDPDNLSDISAALSRVTVDDRLREVLRTKGLAVASRLSWQKTAERTLEVYRRAIKPRRTNEPATISNDAAPPDARYPLW